MPQTLKLAHELAAKSPLAMRYCKAAWTPPPTPMS